MDEDHITDDEFDARDWVEDNSGVTTARVCVQCGEKLDDGAVCDECRDHGGES